MGEKWPRACANSSWNTLWKKRASKYPALAAVVVTAAASCERGGGGQHAAAQVWLRRRAAWEVGDLLGGRGTRMVTANRLAHSHEWWAMDHEPSCTAVVCATTGSSQVSHLAAANEHVVKDGREGCRVDGSRRLVLLEHLQGLLKCKGRDREGGMALGQQAGAGETGPDKLPIHAGRQQPRARNAPAAVAWRCRRQGLGQAGACLLANKVSGCSPARLCPPTAGDRRQGPTCVSTSLAVRSVEAVMKCVPSVLICMSMTCSGGGGPGGGAGRAHFDK